MFRTLASRGASVLVATALLGGGLALGGGTASADQETRGDFAGSVQDSAKDPVGTVEQLVFGALLVGGFQSGSIDAEDLSFVGCMPPNCPSPIPTYKEVFLDWLRSGAGSS
ncbi:hypothetical protein [Rhodococcus sp. NPDC059234]|uniref:hypothetical protein n=1 Tax=Rhodococcus sp. NPDC059234 TaxID=3346781 RepID=UPI00366AF8FD